MDEPDRQRQHIAARLRLAREQAGLSQGQVAKLMGWHRPTVSQIEASQRRVSAEEVAQLAKAYRVSVGWLTQEQAVEDEPLDPQIELAARELSKLRPEDLQRVIRLLSIIKQKDRA